MSIQAALKSPYRETSRKKIVRSVLEVLFYCGLCSFFKKIALKTNMFMIAAMVFSGLVYHWQGNYIEFSNYPFILTTSAIIAFVVPAIIDLLGSLVLLIMNLILLVLREAHELKATSIYQNFSIERINAVAKKNGTITVLQVKSDDVEQYKVFDANETLLKVLTPSDYLQLRSELVQRDIFLTETLVIGFGYLIQTTFKGALHCEDGPALIEYYKDQKTYKHLKSEYYFNNIRYETESSYLQAMESHYFV